MEKEYTVAELEELNMLPDDGRVPHVPFGFLNHRWQEFKAQLQPGDKILGFETSPASWRRLAGQKGYRLVRSEKVITELITVMN
ncbi:hypothetical protein [Prosthecobacter sp.]